MTKAEEDTVHSCTSLYTSRIIKAGALLADTKTLFAKWDTSATASDNLARFRRDNIFAKSSRSRVEDILAIFRQRYLGDDAVARALVRLVAHSFPAESLDRILYFHSARSDALLHDTVTQTLLPLYERGVVEVSTDSVTQALITWAEQGKTAGKWSRDTAFRIAQGLLATLRDFGVLQGKVNKRLSSPHLTTEAFAYIALYLGLQQPSGNLLVGDPEWRLFFLTRDLVERHFIQAHQCRLLEYHAAGSIVRISFPTDSLEEYALVIAEGAH